jgi:hypothetical protein
MQAHVGVLSNARAALRPRLTVLPRAPSPRQRAYTPKLGCDKQQEDQRESKPSYVQNLEAYSYCRKSKPSRSLWRQ